MTDEIRELLNAYQEEVEKCYEIAQKLDAINSTRISFTGSPSERIKRQLYMLGIFK